MSNKSFRLAKRARAHATGWLVPTHNCGAREAEHRVYAAWLSGYEAARRDARNRQRAKRAAADWGR